MSSGAAILGGVAGACALTVAHEVLRHQVAGAPRMDLYGARALKKSLGAMGVTPPRGQALFEATLLGDVLSNAGTYALVGCGRQAPLRGALLGTVLGIGAVVLPEPMGLGKQPGKITPRTELMTIGVYALGGLVAGLAARCANGRRGNGTR